MDKKQAGRPVHWTSAYFFRWIHVAGDQEVMEEQGSTLMAVIPKEVEEAWKGMEGEFCCKENSLRTGGTAAGKKDRNNR